MKITVIVPCYNEQINIQKGTLDKIGNYTSNISCINKVLIIDDGSTDETESVIKKQYLDKFKKFKLISIPHQGKAHAIIEGIKQADGDYVFFTDFDLATPIEEFSKLENKANEGVDVIIGSRTRKREGAPLLRQLQSSGYIVLRQFVVGLRSIKDTQCGFKMFKRSCALTVISKLHVFSEKKMLRSASVSAGFDLEFLFIAQKLKCSIEEVPVKWNHAETKRVSFLKDSVETIRDLLNIKWYDLLGRYNL